MPWNVYRTPNAVMAEVLMWATARLIGMHRRAALGMKEGLQVTLSLPVRESGLSIYS